MQQHLSEILDNILGLLLLEGSYDIAEDENSFNIAIDTKDAGRLIGPRGESLESLQLIVSQILSNKLHSGKDDQVFKRIIVDVMGWRKQKEEDLTFRAKGWAQQVVESGVPLELEPMPAWQRRIVHMVIQEMPELMSESLGEGFNRHLVIKKAGQETSPVDQSEIKQQSESNESA